MFVYFVQPVGGGPIKIGCAMFPRDRLSKLMAWSPYPLQVIATAPGGFCDEARLHCQLRSSYSHGEWFWPTAEVMDLIEGVKKTGSLPFDSIKDMDNRRLAGLPAILKANGISVPAFAKAAGKSPATITSWATWGGRGTAGKALMALEAIGAEFEPDQLFAPDPTSPDPSPREASTA